MTVATIFFADFVWVTVRTDVFMTVETIVFVSRKEDVRGEITPRVRYFLLRVIVVGFAEEDCALTALAIAGFWRVCQCDTSVEKEN